VTSVQFFSWPTGHNRGKWFRNCKTEANTKYARPGDTLTVIYASGARVQARIFHIHTDLDTGKRQIQCEEAKGRRPNRLVAGQPAPPVSQSHTRKRK